MRPSLERSDPKREPDVDPDIVLEEAARVCREFPGRTAEAAEARACAVRLREGGRTTGIHSTGDVQPTDILQHLETSATLEARAECYIALGAAFRQQGRLQEAEATYRDAVKLTPSSLRGLVGLGSIALDNGRPTEAIRLFEKAVALAPDQELPHRGLSDALHMAGDLRRGCREAEWHQPTNGREWRDFEQPEWMPHGAYDGRRVLIWAIGALGDTIQSLRYLPVVKASGGDLIVQCPRPLVPVIKAVPGVDEVVALGAPLPAFDVQQRLTKLPLLFATTLDTIPGPMPYVFAHDSIVERWRRRLALDERFTIGLTWGGNAKNGTAGTRFSPLQRFAPLARLTNVRFVALQLSPQCSELLAPPPGLAVDYVLDDASSLPETAAVIQSLDLVITVDTMMAHLAGGLAKPVWMVTPHVAGCRWLLETERTAWYPTMRIFRQQQTGDWSEVLERVTTAVDEVTRGWTAQARNREVYRLRRVFRRV